MQRQSMLYEKVVNIQLNHSVALHRIAKDTKRHGCVMKEKWFQGWIKKIDSLIKQHSHILVIRFLWNEKKNTVGYSGFWCKINGYEYFHVTDRKFPATLYFCLMSMSVRQTSTDTQVDPKLYTMYIVILVFNDWLWWSALFDVKY